MDDKQRADIKETIGAAMQKTQVFMAEADTLAPANFADRVLRLALNLIQYGEYVKTTLIMAPAVLEQAARRPRARRVIDPSELEGASEEEKAVVERAAPAGFVQ